MAEERIYIGKINWQEPLGFCPVPMGECNSFCEDCQGGMTRQEAIERINHAICVEIHGPCDICEQIKYGNEGHCNDYKKYAEAALNALLEVQNDKENN